MSWFEHGTSRIYYEEEGSGDPLLLIPGWSLSIEDLRPIRQALVPRYRVIAADAPGSGRSEPQPRKYTASYYEDDAAAFLALLDERGASPAHLVGFSDGGEYSLLMAGLKPDAVRSVVTWGSAGHIADSPPGVLEALRNLVDDPLPAFEEFSMYLKGAYGSDNARIMVQSAAEAWRAIIDASGDISWKRADEIACPALLICGEEDVFTITPELVAEMARDMQDAEFVIAKGAGHSVHHDSPEWLTSTIVEWLASR
jgi:valacyclovir hydrolase